MVFRSPIHRHQRLPNLAQIEQKGPSTRHQEGSDFDLQIPCQVLSRGRKRRDNPGHYFGNYFIHSMAFL
jgi:hypothetical protein